MLRRTLLAVLAIASTGAFASIASARLLDADPNLTETDWVLVASDMTGMAWAPDGSGRLFLTRKSGTVRIVQMQSNGSGTLLSTPFATESVYTNSECGLIGIAFDPNFAQNGYLYFFVTVSASEQRIVRYTANGNVGASRTELVRGLPTNGVNHDGGAIGIGFDGHLYWAIGDLGNGTGVQTSPTSLPPLSTLATKVGRATREGTVPGDNPFFDGDGPNNDYVWARGFRNPFTMTFHPVTGDLWLNVVGTNYEQAFIVTRGSNAGYNYYEASQPESAPYLRSVIKYRTGGGESYTLTAAARTGGVTTFTTSARHFLRQGERITVSGVGNASFNGSFYVASVPNVAMPMTFTVPQAALPAASSSGGTVAAQSYGRTIGGGVFYDGTLFPPAFRGNFFFPDFIDNRVVRAVMSGPTTVASVDDFADTQASALDLDVGPDGALYLMRYGGQIVRYGYNRPSQALVLSGQHVRMDEGGVRAIYVRLARVPAANVTVSIARTSGDADIAAELGSLTFTPANFATPQVLRFMASNDADTTDDTARFSVASTGLTSETVEVSVLDDDAAGIQVSTSALAIDEGATGMFTVHLGAAPATSTTVSVTRTGDADVTVSTGASLTFDSTNWSTPRPVVVAAANDADNLDDAATLTVAAAGFASRTVSVTGRDDDARAPMFTSTPVTSSVVGFEYVYDAEATGNPAPAFALEGAPAAMTIDAATGVVRWTPSAIGNVDVTVRATNGVAPDATQTYTLVVAADQPPTASLTRPLDGETVSGTTEYYGDGLDDVGAVLAEFYVDGVLEVSDVGSMGHFHFGGAHLAWDTTRYSDGPHRLRFVVYDATGQEGSQEVDVVIANLADAGPPDRARDAGLRLDAGRFDGGPIAELPAGCGCRAAGREGGPLALVLTMLLLVCLRRRRIAKVRGS